MLSSLEYRPYMLPTVKSNASLGEEVLILISYRNGETSPQHDTLAFKKWPKQVGLCPFPTCSLKWAMKELADVPLKWVIKPSFTRGFSMPGRKEPDTGMPRFWTDKPCFLPLQFIPLITTLNYSGFWMAIHFSFLSSFLFVCFSFDICFY